MLNKFRVNKGIIFIICGFLIILISILFLIFNVEEKNDLSKDENTCNTDLKNQNYKTVSLSISNENITFSIPNCIGNFTLKDSFKSAKSNEGDIVINAYYKLIDIDNLAMADFYDYSLKDEYPNYYLFVEDKVTDKNVEYKVLVATEVKDDKEVQKIYEVMYPLSDSETLELEFLYNNDILNENIFDKIVNSISL